MQDIKIMIACHKECEVPNDSIYLPMHVGSMGKEPMAGFTRDDSGENISAKNPMYCELTGLYWVWKNEHCDVTGLVHYRRYFTLCSKHMQKKMGDLACVLKGEELRHLLGQYKVLVPKKRNYYIETIESHYGNTHDIAHLNETGKILEEICPDYSEDFKAVMNDRGGYMFNMFIMPKALSDAYCAWLFEILGILETRIDTADMNAFEKRYLGRVSEILFNVWLKHCVRTGTLSKEEIHEIPYLYIGKIDWGRKVTSFLSAKLFHKKYDKSF